MLTMKYSAMAKKPARVKNGPVNTTGVELVETTHRASASPNPASSMIGRTGVLVVRPTRASGAGSSRRGPA